MKLINITKAANLLKLTEGQIIELISKNAIPNAEIINEEIFIPSSSVDYISHHKELLFNIQELYGINTLSYALKVSPETIRNWIKLRNIIPDRVYQKMSFFYRDTILKIKGKLEADNSDKLKSRRNKQYKHNNEIYNSYLSASSANITVIKDLITIMKVKYQLEPNQNLTNLILAECALQLINQRLGIWLCGPSDLVRSYLNKEINLQEYTPLLGDLIINNNLALETINTYPEIFKICFCYEEHEDLLGCLYLSLLSLSQRKEHGIYYTPSKVVSQLMGTIGSNDMLDDRNRYFDPCCGTGNFILNLPKAINWTQIYAADLDHLAVTLCRINLMIRNPEISMNELTKHVVCCDYLLNCRYTNDEEENGPLVVMGNPPWGVRYSFEDKLQLSKVYNSASPMNCESFALFVEKSLYLTRTGDYISFVLPESILQVFAHTPVRNQIQKFASIKSCIQLGEQFDGVNCPSIILTLRKESKNETNEVLRCYNAYIAMKNSTAFAIDKDRYYEGSLELFLNNEEYRVLNKILTIKNAKTLKDQADWAIGIVTGDNAHKLQMEKNKDNEPILKGLNIDRYRINHKNLSYIEFKPEEFQQVAKESLYRSEEKLFYRFINQDLYFAYDNKGMLSLNSANIVIPKISGINVKYILIILNSVIARFIYKRKFHSTKVLRNHLETIPIKVISEDEQNYFINAANALIDNKLTIDEENNLINEIDIKLGKIYGLTKNEIQLIRKSIEH